MELETLKALNEGLYPGLMLMIEVTVLITVCLTIAGFASYLAGIVWLCFEETRQPARRQVKKKALAPPAPPPIFTGRNVFAGMKECSPEQRMTQ